MLGEEIREVLDRRKKGLLDSSAMTEEQRADLVKQLMSLVARLEEEMFQAETHKFEAEVSFQASLTLPAEMFSVIQ